MTMLEFVALPLRKFWPSQLPVPLDGQGPQSFPDIKMFVPTRSKDPPSMRSTRQSWTL